MGMVASMREWPWPLRVTHAAFFVGMAIAFVAIFTGSQQRWMYAVAPAAFVLSGLQLVTNLGGAAEAWAEGTARHRPMGVDYSRSVFARPRFVRAFGAAMVLVGGFMLFAATTQPL